MTANAPNLTLTMPSENQMLKDIWNKMPILDTLLTKLQAVSKRVDAMEDRIKILESHTEDLDNGYSYMETQMAEIATSIASKASSTAVDELNVQLVDVINRNKRNNIVLHNVPEKAEGDSSDCAPLVHRIATQVLGIQQSMEIERAHRTPMGRIASRNHGNEHQRPRPIHVRFLRFRDRESFLRVASSKGKEFKISDARIFVSDDVHSSTRKDHQILMKKVRELRAAGNFAFIPWSVPRVIKYKMGAKHAPGPLKTLRVGDI